MMIQGMNRWENQDADGTSLRAEAVKNRPMVIVADLERVTA